MNNPEEPLAVGTPQQVNDLFDAMELAGALNTDQFKHFLDHIPIAIIISKFIRGDHRICYANSSFERMTGKSLADFMGQGWSVLDGFKDESNSGSTLHQAILKGEDEFLGTFQMGEPTALLVKSFAGLIENEDGTENYRIVALIDVTARARTEREEFARQIRDKDMLLKEVQHRVKNNLQLIVALVRLEARAEKRGDRINLAALTGRIELLYSLYHALSPDLPGQEIDLGHYISQIASTVMNTYATDGIRLDLKVEHAPTSINIALPVGLIVNELLTNAFKHAFGGRGQGVITVECVRADEDHYRVVVADNGDGLPEGTVWPVPGKIGALVVQSLRENSDTDLDVVSSPGNGLRVALRFESRMSTRKPN